MKGKQPKREQLPPKSKKQGHRHSRHTDKQELKQFLGTKEETGDERAVNR